MLVSSVREYFSAADNAISASGNQQCVDVMIRFRIEASSSCSRGSGSMDSKQHVIFYFGFFFGKYLLIGNLSMPRREAYCAEIGFFVDSSNSTHLFFQ
jgi:hypothetical protein